MSKRHDSFYQVDVRNRDGSVSVVSVSQVGGVTTIRGNRSSHEVHPAAHSVEHEIELVFGVEVIGRHAIGP